MTSSVAIPPSAEWLEADGLGGFASGTVGGARTRRYHALLLVAVTPPTGRTVLVNGFDAWVERAGVRATGNRQPEYLSTQRYAPDVTAGEGHRRVVSFSAEPWPTWTYRLDDGTEVEQEIFASHEAPVVAVRWRLVKKSAGVSLKVRPFLSGRDSHALHHENGVLRFDAALEGERVRWRPYQGLPGIVSLSNGHYRHEPSWYRHFLLDEERARGFDAIEDLASPGILGWNLSAGEAVWILASDGLPGSERAGDGDAGAVFKRLRASEARRRKAFPSRLHRAADAYLVRRGEGKTIVAGYPWFTDWGRDTFISLRGLCLAAGRLDDARSILLEWAGLVSQGMLPNRFIDQGDAPEFNSVDASLWYVIAVHAYLRRAPAVSGADRKTLEAAVLAILSGYSAGTRYGIGADTDGLLKSGEPGVQLTWMDAKVGDWVVTARTGKAVEIQALWLNALRIGAEVTNSWGLLFEKGRAAFLSRFWHEAGGYLYDVVDADHRPGNDDASFRPNQLFAIGGLPFQLLEGNRARRVVDAVEARLWTPLGPRSLAPGEPGYTPRYEGGPVERDGAYHQGTVWPWLAGPFVEAWVRVRGDTSAARREARARFLEPLLTHLDEVGLGHLPEIADADPPHTPRGCPFQAWSVGEALRLDLDVLLASVPKPARRRSKVTTR